MPPGPVFNWVCVASSVADILVRAARIRAAQLTKDASLVHTATSLNNSSLKPSVSSGRPHADGIKLETWSGAALDARDASSEDNAGTKIAENDFLGSAKDIPAVRESRDASSDRSEQATEPFSLEESSLTAAARDDLAVHVEPEVAASHSHEEIEAVHVDEITANGEPESSPIASSAQPLRDADLPVITRQLQSSKVPSSRIGRLFHYGGLAASLGYGAASELIRRSTTAKSDESQSIMLTEANVTRLVSKLSQMRGAALKLGQFLSIQDTHVLPAQVDAIFRRVQDSANYMPDWQMEQVMQGALGPSWQDSFESFDRVPFAAASIGQVHTATLTASASPTGLPERIAVKIQFPNIANSIKSDLGYVSMLLTAGRMLPKGLFLDRTMKAMKEELADECDYAREAESIRKFGTHLAGDKRFRVPWVWDGGTERVLVMERVDGVSVGDASVLNLSQEDRNEIAARIIELCLLELFSFRLMQTDPNYSNFLWDARSRRLSLIDFGATRAYGKEFMDGWLRLLQAAAAGERDACIEESKKIGYLTGEENDIMLNAHTDSLILLATPFAPPIVTPQPFSFGPNTPWAGITQQIRERIPVMIHNRLTPPPRETYSLNRKLSGAFLLASRLGATVDTRAIWEKVVSGYEFSS
ncbi:ABC1-domain-containing protein [Mycena amicta]|nr:ABC1-domain-containing protein [Mycena amicta]